MNDKIELAAPEKGSVYQVAVCDNCGRDIMLMPGDSLWVHDATGWRRCDGIPDWLPKEFHAHLSIV